MRMVAQTRPGPSHAAMRRYESLALSSRLMASNPHELVSVLYEELARALDVARLAVSQQKPDSATLHLDRARSILIALESGLDFDAGGDLAGTLASVYKAMQRELARCTRELDEEGLIALRSGVAEIHASWRAISPRAQ